MILNLRGSSGSGKSHVGWSLAYHAVRRCELPIGHPFNDRDGPLPIGYELPGRLVVLGSYGVPTSPTSANRGVEGLLRKREGAPRGELAARLRDLIALAARGFPHVFCEGFNLNQAGGPWIDLARDLTTDGAWALPVVVGLLDTPLEVCLARIEERRVTARATSGEPVDPAFQRKMWDGVATELEVITIDHTRAVEDVVEQFKAAGWRP